MNEINQIIKFHRKKSGLTQIELASLAGVGKATVFDIEKGKETVQLDSLLKVIKVLNIKFEFSSPLMELYKKQEK